MCLGATMSAWCGSFTRTKSVACSPATPWRAWPRSTPTATPNVTPLWFIWENGEFFLASDAWRPHLARIRSNPNVGLVIDVEEDERSDGERPKHQVRVIGDATLSPDPDGTWTRRMWAIYHRGGCVPDAEVRLRGRQRALITSRPRGVVAVASV
jgi:hypothetical protein